MDKSVHERSPKVSTRCHQVSMRSNPFFHKTSATHFFCPHLTTALHGRYTRMMYKDCIQGQPNRAAHQGSPPGHRTRTPYKDTIQGHRTRTPYKDTVQEHRTRTPYKDTVQGLGSPPGQPTSIRCPYAKSWLEAERVSECKS